MTSTANRAVFTGAQGLTLIATETGPKQGMPVILSHGGGQTRFAWGNTAKLLAEAGFHVLAVDLRGHGDSDWVPAGAGYDIADYAEDIRQITATLRRPPVLVGASLGGIASIFAASEPPVIKIAGLCLVDVSPHLVPEGVEGILGFMREGSAGFASLQDAAIAVGKYQPHRPPPSDLEGLRKNLREADDGRFYWHWDPRTIERPFLPAEINPRFEAAALQIKAPTLLLRGEFSEVVTREVAETYMAKFTNGVTQDVPGARHMVAGDRNDLFGALLLSFVISVRNDLMSAAVTESE